MIRQDRISSPTAALILFAGVSATGTLIPRYDTILLALGYFSGFFGYFWFCRFTSGFHYMLSVGIVCRLFLFFSMPGLSDDIYRFLWDGYLTDAGVSPFARLPNSYVLPDPEIPGLTTDLYQKLNSPGYFSVYPPFNQFIFWLGAQVRDNWLLSANIIRSLLFLADIGSFLLLRKLLLIKDLDPGLARWYFLNPLVILECTGNLHFEGLVVFFLLSGLYFLAKGKNIFSGAAMGMAIATKLLPLIYLPALLTGHRQKQGIVICAAAGLVTLLSLLPMLDAALLSGISSSLGLYIKKFEFNASIYFLLRGLGYGITGYNTIFILGPLLSVVSILLIVLLAFYAGKKQWPLEKTMLCTLMIYLTLATTVHPWYTVPLMAFGILSGFYFPIIWSLMIFVTYFGYTKAGYELSIWWIVLEYMVVFAAIFLEFKKAHEKVV